MAAGPPTQLAAGLSGLRPEPAPRNDSTTSGSVPWTVRKIRARPAPRGSAPPQMQLEAGDRFILQKCYGTNGNSPSRDARQDVGVCGQVGSPAPAHSEWWQVRTGALRARNRPGETGRRGSSGAEVRAAQRFERRRGSSVTSGPGSNLATGAKPSCGAAGLCGDAHARWRLPTLRPARGRPGRTPGTPPARGTGRKRPWPCRRPPPIPDRKRLDPRPGRPHAFAMSGSSLANHFLLLLAADREGDARCRPKVVTRGRG